MVKLRSAIAATVLGAAIAAQGAVAQTPPDPPPPEIIGPPGSPAAETPVPALPPPPAPKPKPKAKPKPAKKPSKGSKGRPARDKSGEKNEEGVEKPKDGGTVAVPPPILPNACGPIAVPVTLIPIYQRASVEYGLGPAGPSILAAINEIETGFGQNLGPSSAGAMGWMQFMPSTWDAYGVDADGDGRKDPDDPDDAIFAAARYLSAAGMPEDPEGAVFAYNHADWYVADVMARAACFGGVGNGAIGDLSLIPKRQELVCTPSEEARDAIPEEYLGAFQTAAGRYELGEDGVWALAAVARLESDYGRGMSPEEMRARGPLGIEEENWQQFAVDGDGDGKLKRESPGDSAATLARMIWASGDLRAGLFQHNHASWYVDEVIEEAEQMAGKCEVRTVAYSVVLPGPTSAPINWENVELSNSLEMLDIQQGAIDPRILVLIAAISQDHTLRISSLRSDHGQYTSGGNVSNHYFGRAMDIAEIDGVPCTVTDVDGPCGTMTRALASLPEGQKPTELIYCFDADGPGPAFAAADHCDHIHIGFDS
jgi:soluble lytic murein transglycosylase-like protein